MKTIIRSKMKRRKRNRQITVTSILRNDGLAGAVPGTAATRNFSPNDSLRHFLSATKPNGTTSSIVFPTKSEFIIGINLFAKNIEKILPLTPFNLGDDYLKDLNRNRGRFLRCKIVK